MNPIHILHVTRTLDPSEGLLPRLAVRIAAHQALAGHKVTLLTMDNTRAMVLAQPEYEHLAGYQHLHIYHSNEKGPLSYLFGNAAIKWMQPIVAHLSVIHLHGMWEALLRRAAQLGHEHSIPLVVTPHPGRAAPAPGFTRPALNLVMRMSWKNMLKQAHMVHALGDEDDLRLRKMGLQSNIVNLPDGSDLAARVTQSYPLGGWLPKPMAGAPGRIPLEK